MFKRLLFVGLSLCLVGSVLGADAVPTLFAANVGAYDCEVNLSNQEAEKIFNIVGIFEQYDYVFENKFPGSSLYIDSFVEKAKDTIYCYEGTEKFADYNEFEAGLKLMILEIIQLKEEAVIEIQEEVNEEAKEALMKLQMHMGNMFNFANVDMMDENKAVAFDTNFDIDVSVKDALADDMNLVVAGDIDGKINNVGDGIDINVDLEGNMSMSDEYCDYNYDTGEEEGCYSDDMSVVASMDTNILISQEDLYVKFNELNVDLSSSDPMEDAMVNGEIKEFYNTIAGKYIHADMSLGNEFGESMVIWTNTLNWNKIIYEESLFTAYSKGGKNIVKLNPEFCEVVANDYEVNDCKESFADINDEMGDSLIFDYVGANKYRISVLDLDQEYFDDFYIIWDNYKINEVKIKDIDGVFDLSLMNTDLSVTFGEDLVIKGTIIPQKLLDLEISGMIDSYNDTKIDGTIKVEKGAYTNTVNTDININISEDGENLADLMFKGSTVYRIINRFNIIKPSNIIEAEEVEDLM